MRLHGPIDSYRNQDDWSMPSLPYSHHCWPLKDIWITLDISYRSVIALPIHLLAQYSEAVFNSEMRIIPVETFGLKRVFKRKAL